MEGSGTSGRYGLVATRVPLSEGPRKVAKDPNSELGRAENAVREWARDAAFAIRALQGASPAPVAAPVAIPVRAAPAAAPALPPPAPPPLDPDLVAIAALVGAGFLFRKPDNTWGLSTTVVTLATLPPAPSPADETIGSAIAAIDIGSGRFLHIRADGMAIYADASIGFEAHCYTKQAVVAGDPVTLSVGPVLDGLSGLTVGSTYWLSATTPGLYTDTPPTPGLVQRLAFAIKTDTLIVEIEPALVAIA